MKRNSFSAAFKAKVGCAALRENKTINELASIIGCFGVALYFILNKNTGIHLIKG